MALHIMLAHSTAMLQRAHLGQRGRKALKLRALQLQGPGALPSNYPEPALLPQDEV